MMIDGFQVTDTCMAVVGTVIKQEESTARRYRLVISYTYPHIWLFCFVTMGRQIAKIFYTSPDYETSVDLWSDTIAMV